MLLVWSKFVHQRFFFLPFWKVMANSLRDRIELVGTWYIPSIEGWLRQAWIHERKGWWAGLKRLEWNIFADSHNNLLNHNHPSVRWALLETSRDGSVSFRQQHWKLLQRVEVNFYCTGTRIIPHSPLSWAWDLQGKRGCPPASSSGRQGALHQNTPGAPTWREVRGMAWLELQSPFSSSFCKLFCIFSNRIMLAVSSWHRASTFNCTCDPRPDGAVCSVWWVSTMEVSDPSCSSRVLILYLM